MWYYDQTFVGFYFSTLEKSWTKKGQGEDRGVGLASTTVLDSKGGRGVSVNELCLGSCFMWLVLRITVVSVPYENVCYDNET